MSADRADPETAARRLTGLVAGLAGSLMHLVVGGFYVATGLLAPPWATLALGMVWLALGLLLLRWRRSRPLWALTLPFVAAAVWWLAVTAGDRWLGWSA